MNEALAFRKSAQMRTYRRTEWECMYAILVFRKSAQMRTYTKTDWECMYATLASENPHRYLILDEEVYSGL